MKLWWKEWIFNIIQWHQITDETLYLSEWDIPVFTWNNDIKWYWNKTIIKEDQLPCITYPTKWNSWVAFIQEKLFDANNTAVLLLKEKYKNDISLEYISCILPKLFLEMMTSKWWVSYLNKEIVAKKKINYDEIKYEEWLYIRLIKKDIKRNEINEIRYFFKVV